MATHAAVPSSTRLHAELVATFPGIRVLAWDADLLYASRGYDLLSARACKSPIEWTKVASFSGGPLRRITSEFRLTSRLLRDGFHALTIIPNRTLITAVPGAIVILCAGNDEFQITHKITRGTRPLHICSSPDGRALWGEYFANRERDEVHVFASDDGGLTWHVAHTFAAGAIRHVHNIVYDHWADSFWIFTGDEGHECKIIRVSRDLSCWDEVLAGSQQCRAVAAMVAREGLYFASDTPLEPNFIHFLHRSGRTRKLEQIPSSSIYGCSNRNGLFFSTMVEPSDVNLTRNAALVGSADGSEWQQIASFRKDFWPMRWFQFGNIFLPDGNNTTDLLAATTIAVEGADLKTHIWRTSVSSS